MTFKPMSSNTNTTSTNQPKVDYNAINRQVKGGSRPARISLIVDLGVQNREAFKEEYKPDDAKQQEAIEKRGATVVEEEGKQILVLPRAPAPEIAVFADLTSDVVDYGGEIGKQPYRLCLNGSDYGNMRGIAFSGCYSFDKNGNILKEKGFTFHSNSPLSKLAKATKQEQIIAGSGADNMDVSQLLDKPVMVQVSKTENGEKVYLNYKGCSEVPLVPSDPSDPDSEEVMMNVKPLSSPALVITFDNVTMEHKKYLRGDLIKKIKQATNYVGSKMQQVIEANNTQPVEPEPEEAPAKAVKAKPAKVDEPELEADCPF